MAEIRIKNIGNGEAVWVLDLCKKLGFEMVEMGFDGIDPVCAVGCGKLRAGSEKAEYGRAKPDEEGGNKFEGNKKKASRVERFVAHNRKKV
jgi:hypothetical protein